jgi:hypothetical protein
MMELDWRRARRAVMAGALAAAALLVSGCVYLRLLQLKRQLADFDANFTVQTAAGLRLNCLHPVVLADDLRFLGFFPASVRKLGTAEQWTIRWLKQPPPGAPQKPKYEIGFDLFFAQDHMAARADNSARPHHKTSAAVEVPFAAVGTLVVSPDRQGAFAEPLIQIRKRYLVVA